jgi:hypothetical protein
MRNNKAADRHVLQEIQSKGGVPVSSRDYQRILWQDYDHFRFWADKKRAQPSLARQDGRSCLFDHIKERIDSYPEYLAGLFREIQPEFVFDKCAFKNNG